MIVAKKVLCQLLDNYISLQPQYMG